MRKGFGKYGICGLGLVVVLMAGCATTPKPEVISEGKHNYLKKICTKNGIYWQWDHVAQQATLSYRGIKAEVLVGSNLVIVDKERVALSEPVRIIQSAVVVPDDFNAKVVNVMKRYASEQKTAGPSIIREVIIDAGHGGKDPGAIGRDGEYEKKVVLDISQRLKRILQVKGVKVKMTRETDEFISLQERTQIASRSKADLFISIHANSNPVRSVHGLEVYTAKYLNYHERNDGQRQVNSGILFNHLAMNRDGQDLENIVSDMLYTHKQAESENLAGYLSRRTARQLRTKDLGQKESRFYVVKNTLIPAILVEVGFLSNPKESKLLKTSEYRQRIARGIAESILDYSNGR